MIRSTITRFAVLTSLTGALIGAASVPASAATVTNVYSGDGDTLRAVFYQNADFTGNELRYYGGSSCSSSTTDTDYSMSTMPSGWNDQISAIRDYNGCDVKLYADGPFAGSTTGYVNYGSVGKYVGSSFNDKTSSLKVS